MLQESTEEVEINFRETVTPGAGVFVTRSYSQGGHITKVMFHFPDGCNALVDMALTKDLKSYYPLNGYLALNNATPVYQNLTTSYYPNEPLRLEIRNRDSLNSHTVSCTVVIRFSTPIWWR